MRAGDLPGHGCQALEGTALVLEQTFGGDRHLVLAVAPFAQQHGAGREVGVARASPQLDLGMLGTDALGVFCEDREVRRELATIFRDVVLACDGEINDMPMREFDLFGFSTPAMLKRIEQERVAGIEKISILQIKVARPFEQQTTDAANGRELIQHLSSTMLIGKDRRDTRQIYQVAYDDYGIDDLTEYTLAQVKLVFRMAKQPHRKAHNVAVQITSPNGLNDKSKTEDDRKRVLEQLTRIGVLREF